MLGKKCDTRSGALIVVAGALQRADGLWLMQQRPFEKHHGGLWEFPGGKVESVEIPVKALCRELDEELGITIDSAACIPLFFAQSPLEAKAYELDSALVLLLYKVASWRGEPRAMEGGVVDWFEPEAIAGLPKPPLDMELAARLLG